MRWTRSIATLAVLALSWAALAGLQSRPTSGLPRGAQAYLAHCASCHGETGAGDGPLAPWLRANGSPEPARLDGAKRMEQLGLAGVQQIVAKGGAHVGRFRTMPQWGPRVGAPIAAEVSAWAFGLPALTPAQREAVNRWLESPAGCLPDGRRAYVLHCAACHGPRGAGDGYFTAAVRAKMKPGNLADASAFEGVSDDSLHVLLSPSGAHAADVPGAPTWLRALDAATVDAAVSYVRALQTSAKP